MNGKNFIHCLKCIAGLETAVTQTTANEQSAMVKYVNHAAAIAEIGVFEGYNTLQFALHSPGTAKIYAIDPFTSGSLGISYGRVIATNNWKKHKVAHKIKIVQGLSWDVRNTINEPLDFIFIDGDHSFEGVKKDFELYSVKLSGEGVIAFHDARIFSRGWTQAGWGPVQLVDEIRNNPNWKILEETDSLVFIKRNL